MITDARVLDPDFVPPDIVRRESEITQLSHTLQPITRGETVEPILLTGRTGTGKTCLAQFLTEELRETVIDLNTQYVNCWRDYSRFKALYRVLDGIDRTLDIHRQSTPTDELIERIYTYDGPPYVVILDEVDQLKDTGVLHDLYRAPRITIILITNRDQDLFTRLDHRLTSRLLPSPRIHLDRYTADELCDILTERVRLGLWQDVITRAQLEQIANEARGDARIAIAILRVAARTATTNTHDTITDEIIAESIPEARADLTNRTIATLTQDQQLLYRIITAHGEITPGELYAEYEAKATDPKTTRTVRNYLQKMTHYNLIMAIGSNRGRKYKARSELP